MNVPVLLSIDATSSTEVCHEVISEILPHDF